jgi:hypothetical protein
VISGWYFEDQATPSTERRHTAGRRPRMGTGGVGPELTNALRTGCLRRRPTAEKAQQILAHLARLPIDTDRHAVPRQKLLARPWPKSWP